MKTTQKFWTAALVIVAIATTSSIGHARLTRDQRISDAKTLIAMFEHRYAPVIWKKDFLGISLDDLSAKLVGEAYRDDMTDEDFYAAMARVSGGVHDTHNWFIIPSNYVASLGFSCDYIDGKVVIEDVDRSVLPEDVFPYSRGDELVSIDGVSAADIIKDLSQYSGNGNELTEMRFIAADIAYRMQKYYPYVPSGDAAVQIASMARGAVESVKLNWVASGQPLSVDPASNTSSPTLKSSSKDPGTEPSRSPLERLRWSAVAADKPRAVKLSDPHPSFTLWDSFVERTTSPLFSGVYFLDGKRIGFIRIPTWAPPDSKEWIAFFEQEIPKLEATTDALVIDQTDNGGGAICLGETIARFFVSGPVQSNLFQIRANRHFLMGMEEWLKSNDIDWWTTPDGKTMQNVLDEIRAAIDRGDVLTKPLPICSADGMVHPYEKNGIQIVYTKPVLMLINELSISTADMTPAILQDSGRVVMFGNHTCGAGGNVETTERIGYSDFKISQTESLTVRPNPVTLPDGKQTNYLENVGVIPDVQYDITLDEYLNGYLGYRQAIDDTMRALLGI
jgi:hypothetical protein